MRVTVLHTREAGEPPIDPVLAQLAAALRTNGHDPALVLVADDLEVLTASLRRAAPELVFNLGESFRGKSALESNIAAVLNLLDLRYTGSSPAGLLVAGDKSLTKKVLSFHGIRTPEFASVYRGAVDWAGDIAFPLIVKPPQEDASLGITASSIVHDLRELLAKIDELQSRFQQPVLLEEYVEGREFYVGVLGNAQAEALPLVELDFSALPAALPRIASWEAKWGEDGAGSGAAFAGTKAIFPTDVPSELEERIRRVAVDAFQALRLRDYGRVDLRVTAAEEIFVLEVNPNCYLEREGEYARAAARSGLPYERLVGRIMDLALARYAR